MYLIKFGGSVITEKSQMEPVFKQTLMDQLSDSLNRANKEYMIVHGAGSFGHVLAKKHDLNMGYQSDDQLLGFAKTQALVQTLNTHVLSSLQQHGLPAISIPPHATMILDNHQQKHFNKRFYETYQSKGFLPVTYGDVVLDTTLGFSICSGDLLMMALTETFTPEKVIFVIDEDGLYWENPKKNPDAAFIDQICCKELVQLSTALDDHSDVTGGMKGKLEAIRKITSHNIDVHLLNGNKPGRLYDALVGNDTTSTLIFG